MSSESPQKQSLHDRLHLVRTRMEKAHKRYVPNQAMPQLIVVSKTFPATKIIPVLDLGQRVFGENRVQEAMEKWPGLKEQYLDVQLHLIGPLQTNKVKEAVKLFDVIQTLDREKLAISLAREMKKTGKSIPVFVQVNIGGEAQKSGVEISQAVSFVDKCKNDLELNVVGLMCIPPAAEAPGPYFALLHDLAKKAKVEFLSMGMSSDYDVAIEMGATHVRVGTAIFGTR
ncbi:MAG: YggS family pyridoxal phosphate-dependent enzyme [Devosiaceae bacterium]|nr:YggS family pyridoxal phosphate-dependent enzyme [Devosiaceae bacterium]